MKQSKRSHSDRKPAANREPASYQPAVENLEDRTVPAFVGAPSIAVGVGPAAFALADFNNDGRMDVATANQLGNSVSILLSNGNGTFQAPIDFQAGSAPVAIVAGDFNGDGHMDLAVANSTSNSVSIFLGNGDGTFQAGASYAVGNTPDALAVADLNGDGKLDLAVANRQSNDITLLNGNGDGTFQAAAHTVATGTAPVAIVAGDFNGDGHIDLATANSGSQSVSILFGLTPGVYVPHVDFATNGVPLSMTVADLNQDGVTDLVVGKDHAVGVLLGNGNGTFQDVIDTPVNSGSYYVNTGDFNGDDKTDVIITNYQHDSMSLLLGKGNGSFQAPVAIDAGAVPTATAVGDFNGDGKTDVLVGNSPSSTTAGGLRVLLGNGNGTFRTSADFATGAGPTSVAWGDVNGDGKIDLVTANSQAGNVSVLLGNGDGTFQAPVNYLAGAGPATVRLADLNGDGKLDIVVANAGANGVEGNTVSVLMGNGNGTFQAATAFTAGTAPLGLTVGDFNGDGKLDVATANIGSGNVSILLGNGDGTFQAARNIATGANPSAIVAGDFNGDGMLDLAVTNANLQGAQGSVSVFLGRGDGTFRGPINVDVGLRPTGIAAADLNGDGQLDLVVADSAGVGGNPGAVSVLVGRGNGTFQPAQNYVTNDGAFAVAIADVNGDGRPDIVTADGGADTVSVLVGKGNGAFFAPVRYGVGAHPQSIVAADLNGDGGTDLITANTGTSVAPGQNISVLMNDQAVASQFQFSQATWTVKQNASSLTIVVTRTGNLNAAATVQYATSDGTATAGEDYLSAAGTLRFAPGEITKSFSIPILDDHLVGGANETVNVTLSNPGGGPALGNPSTGIVTIRNIHQPHPGALRFSAATYRLNESDGTALITVTRVGGSDGEVTVHYTTVGGSAVPGTNYTPVSGTLTFASGETTKTFTIPVLDDGIFRGNRTIGLRLDHVTGGAVFGRKSAVVIIADSDPIQHCTLEFAASSYDVTEGAGTATVTVTRTGDSTGAVQVNYVAVNGTAKGGVDYTRVRGTITFAAGEMSKTIEIPIIDDHTVERQERFHIVLAQPVGGAKIGAQSRTTVNIIDNDSALAFTATRYTVNQSDGTVTITVERTGNTAGTVTVHYATSDGTAKAGTDYVAAEGDLTFGDGETSKTFTININTVSHPGRASESFFVNLTNPEGEAALGKTHRAAVVIRNE